MIKINYWARDHQKDYFAILAELSAELDKTPYKNRIVGKRRRIYEYDCGAITLREAEADESVSLRMYIRGILGNTIEKNRRTLRGMLDPSRFKLILNPLFIR